MLLDAATFTDPPIAMTALQTLITDYLTKQAAKASRAKADVLAARVAREGLEETLADLGGYVNTVGGQGRPRHHREKRHPLV
ncbi:MAG: hypothetical protein K1X78_00680 [Verrucomicrobiaceae bacterium]|nr:hypothetical protein [Verrucomicrobiaceae bacterium]